MDEAIIKASARHPKPKKEFQYGTAGFRMKAILLDSVVFRVGLVAALRSRRLSGQTVGVMITASHNPPEDNGVKLVDPMGEMLEASWEAYATKLANAETDKDVLDVYRKLVVDLKIKADAPARVVFARDTRESGPGLVKALVDGLNAVNAEHTDYHLLTTPQLHYMVRCINTQGTKHEYGEPTEQGYYRKTAEAFVLAMKSRRSQGHVVVDCANGVGGPKLRELLKSIPSAADGGVDMTIVNENTADPDALNVKCGADYVKTQQRAPPSSQAKALERCASFDGDADRIVYYYNDSSNTFQLLDGDRIATLAAAFLGDLGRQSGLSEQFASAPLFPPFLSPKSLYHFFNLGCQIVRFTPSGCFGVDSHGILGATGPRKGSALFVLAHQLVDLRLRPFWSLESSFGIHGAKEVAVTHLHFN